MRITPLALAFVLTSSLVPRGHLHAQPSSQPELPSGWTHKTTQYANRDMVAAANPLAVEAGVTVLKRGGSAVDAAIAVQMMLTLVEPQSSGIGGGAFLLHYDGKAKTLVGYDGRETAPAAATPDQFLKLGKPRDFLDAVTGGLSVGTPGVISMMAMVHAKHGKLPWAALFQPAIDLAEKGFPISPRLHTAIAGTAERLCREKAVAAHYLEPDCTAKDEGTLLKNPELATTLRAIAKGGPKAFYSGPIAEAIVDAVRSHPTNPGRLTLQDLASYTPAVREPICGPYRGLRICGIPPESSGTIAVLQTLGILEQFDVAKLTPNSLDAVHLISEAYRLAYADRQKFGCHVGGGPEQDTCAGQDRRRRRLRRRDGLGEAEVEDLYLAVARERDVRGLQVAVRDRLVVRGLERRRDLRRDPQGLVHGHRAAGEALSEAVTVDEFQHEHMRGSGVLEPVDLRDVGMVQRREQLRFPSEARHTLGIRREGLRQQLERNISLQSRIPGAIDVAHPAGADQLLHDIGADDNTACQTIRARRWRGDRLRGAGRPVAHIVEQRLDLASQVVVVAARLAEQLVPLARGAFPHRVEDLLDDAQPFRRHQPPPG